MLLIMFDDIELGTEGDTNFLFLRIVPLLRVLFWSYDGIIHKTTPN